jgi:hypothetical protein
VPDERNADEPSFPPPPPPSAPPGYFGTPTAPAGWEATPPSQWGYASSPPQWRSLRGLTTALTILLWITVPINVLLVIGVIHHLSVLSDHEVGGLVFDPDPVNDAATFPAAMLVLFALLSIAIFIVFVIWLYRAAKNNEALGRDNTRFSPGWSIGAWFIPLANLVIPVLIVRDLWRGSDPSVPRGEPNWRRAPGGAIVGWWWAAYLVMTIPWAFTGLGKNSEGKFSNASDLRRSDTLRVVSAVGAIAAAVLALTLVRRLSARQEECLRAQQAAAAAPAPPPGP